MDYHLPKAARCPWETGEEFELWPAPPHVLMHPTYFIPGTVPGTEDPCTADQMHCLHGADFLMKHKAGIMQII